MYIFLTALFVLCFFLSLISLWCGTRSQKHKPWWEWLCKTQDNHSSFRDKRNRWAALTAWWLGTVPFSFYSPLMIVIRSIISQMMSFFASYQQGKFHSPADSPLWMITFLAIVPFCSSSSDRKSRLPLDHSWAGTAWPHSLFSVHNSHQLRCFLPLCPGRNRVRIRLFARL